MQVPSIYTILLLSNVTTESLNPVLLCQWITKSWDTEKVFSFDPSFILFSIRTGCLKPVLASTQITNVYNEVVHGLCWS